MNKHGAGASTRRTSQCTENKLGQHQLIKCIAQATHTHQCKEHKRRTHILKHTGYYRKTCGYLHEKPLHEHRKKTSQNAEITREAPPDASTHYVHTYTVDTIHRHRSSMLTRNFHSASHHVRVRFRGSDLLPAKLRLFHGDAVLHVPLCVTKNSSARSRSS